MQEHEWPLTVKLKYNAECLDSWVVPAPKQSTLRSSGAIGPEPVLSQDPIERETQLFHDMLCTLNGGEGEYIRYVETFDPEVLDDKLKGPHYRLPLDLDPGLRDVVSRLTEVAGSAYVVKTFADHFGEIEYGRVNQALSSAFRVLYRLYLTQISKIERSGGSTHLGFEPEEEQKSLYTIWVHLEPFASHLLKARELTARFMEETRLARERKRRHGDLDLVERASTANFVDHDEKEAVIELRGGAVLQSIAELMRREMGDSEAANLYEELLSAASKPYLQTLENWLSRGELDDPFEEFLIQETQAYSLGASASHQKENLDDYWDKRFTVRTMALPLQLSSPNTYNMLLTSGKYLNVIRDTRNMADRNAAGNQTGIQAGAGNTSTAAATAAENYRFELKGLNLTQCRSIEDPQVLDAILRAYQYSNKTLLQVFRSPPVLNLRNLLEKLREVFFLHDSELYDNFALNMKSELSKPLPEVSLSKLEQGLALLKDQDDPWNQYISVDLSSKALKDAMMSVVASGDESEDQGLANKPPKDSNNHHQSDSKLTGQEVIQFDFTVPFPLNLVVSRRSIVRYQFLFRHIIDLKSAKDLLISTWLSQVKDLKSIETSTHEGNAEEGDDISLAAANCMRRVARLRQRKLQLLTDLLYHSTVDGIQQEFTPFLESIDPIEEVSELVDAQLRFLDRSLTKCLLSDPQLLKTQTRLTSLCHQFAKFLDANSDAIAYFSQPQRESFVVDESGKELSRENVLIWFVQTLEKYEGAFNRNLQKFSDQIVAYMPNNFIAGASLLYLLQRLEPLLQAG